MGVCTHQSSSYQVLGGQPHDLLADVVLDAVLLLEELLQLAVLALQVLRLELQLPHLANVALSLCLRVALDRPFESHAVGTDQKRKVQKICLSQGCTKKTANVISWDLVI